MTDVSTALPDELEATLDSLDFEEDGWITLAGFRTDGPRCSIDLALWTGVHDAPAQHWRFTFADCFAYRLTGGDENAAWRRLRLHAAPYVLLDPWTEPSAQLWFSGAVAEPARVAEALRCAHVEYAAGMAGLPRRLNRELALAELLGSRIGELASGPAPLLRAYADVLRAHGMEPTLREHSHVHAQNRRGFDASSLRALTWGSSFLIGTGFRAEHGRSALADRHTSDESRARARAAFYRSRSGG